MIEFQENPSHSFCAKIADVCFYSESAKFNIKHTSKLTHQRLSTFIIIDEGFMNICLINLIRRGLFLTRQHKHMCANMFLSLIKEA